MSTHDRADPAYTTTQTNGKSNMLVSPWWIATIVAAVALAVYVATLASDLVGGDGGEFQFIPYVLGIPHHTGYPLYTLIGKLWSLIPLGSVALRMNLLSAVFGAATVAFVYLAAWELTGRLAPSLLAAASFAGSELFWLWSTMAGVRSSTPLTIIIAIYLALRYQRLTRTAPGDRAAATAFVWLAFAYGIALAHHRSAILLALPLAIFLLAVNPKIILSYRMLARGALFFILPLLTYLYLPIRSIMGTSFDQFHPDTLPRFLDLVLATRLSQSFFSVPQAEMPARLMMFATELLHEFGYAGIALGILGMCWLLFRRPLAFVLMALFAISVILQTLNWNVGQDNLNVVYLIPFYATFAIWIAVGGSSIGRALARVLSRLRLEKLVYVLVTALLIVPFFQQGMANWNVMQSRAARPLDKFRQNLDGGFMARRLVMASLPYVEDDAIIFADWEQATPFWYVQQIEGLKRKVELVYGTYSIEEIEKRAGQRPAYLAHVIPIPQDKKFSSVGPLVKLVGSQPIDVPANLKPLNYVLGSQIALLGYIQYGEQGDVVDHFDANAKVLPITLYWKALTRPKEDYSVSVRLVDSAGKDVAQMDNKHPVLSLYPTSHWSSGEVVGDYYEMSLQDLAPGKYRLEVIMYASSAQGWHNLEVVDPSGRSIGERAAVVSIEKQ